MKFNVSIYFIYEKQYIQCFQNSYLTTGLTYRYLWDHVPSRWARSVAAAAVGDEGRVIPSGWEACNMRVEGALSVEDVEDD